MDKRGISPVIATLLLISFAVALGVVIMQFGRAQVELEAQCAIDVGLHFSTIEGVEQQVCYDEAKKELRFTIENGVNIKVEGLILNIIGTEQAQTSELNDAKLAKDGTYVGQVKYNTATHGQARQVTISPKVILYDEELTCTKKSIVTENVKNC